MRFEPFDPSAHDANTRDIISRIPPPVEVRELPAKDGWCIRAENAGLYLAAIAPTIAEAGQRLLKKMDGCQSSGGKPHDLE